MWHRFDRVFGPALTALLCLTVLAASGQSGDDKKPDQKVEKKKTPGVWTDPNDKDLLGGDFRFQGEYVGEIQGGGKLGCQVIALGQHKFQAVILPGGLPGAGWDGKNKILQDGELGTRKDNVLDFINVHFRPTTGKRKYLAQKPEEFSATSKFPPVGHKEYQEVMCGDKLWGKTDDGKPFALKKTVRKSPTLGQKPPDGAIVLYDGTGSDEWKGGRLDKKTGLLNTDGHDITTKRKFSNYLVHVEFMLPYRPDARGQGRGNSGFYQVDHYEVQILDSFGLEGKNNECGGIYSLVAPKLNMCLPPLTWQTYDVEFTNAVRDADGKKIKNSRITVKLNGVAIHDNVAIPGVTGGARSEPEGTPGILRLQGHGNPLQFRNIWIVEKKS